MLLTDAATTAAKVQFVTLFELGKLTPPNTGIKRENREKKERENVTKYRKEEKKDKKKNKKIENKISTKYKR